MTKYREILRLSGLGLSQQSIADMNILVRRSRQSGVARATNPDFESHRLLLILLVSDLNHILLA